MLKVILCMKLSMKFYPILLLTYSDTCSTCLHCSSSFFLLFSTCLFLSTPLFPVNISKFGVSSGGGGGGGFLLLTAFNLCPTCLLCSLFFHLLSSTCLFLFALPFLVISNSSGVPSGGGGGGGFLAAFVFFYA